MTRSPLPASPARRGRFSLSMTLLRWSHRLRPLRPYQERQQLSETFRVMHQLHELGTLGDALTQDMGAAPELFLVPPERADLVRLTPPDAQHWTLVRTLNLDSSMRPDPRWTHPGYEPVGTLVCARSELVQSHQRRTFHRIPGALQILEARDAGDEAHLWLRLSTGSPRHVIGYLIVFRPIL